ncbi:MmgE/PrpD family protein [Pigmentiphaga soli]|uniref:MmgE/PrpD family protein n=1 Tax=Pigmentiphaga soli TaxID=1007095 RepID=A0ABP8GMA2_9BURK
MTLSRDLIRVLLEKRAHIPSKIRAKGLLHIIDNLGIAVAASRRSSVAAQMVKSLGFGANRGNCRVFGQPDGAPPVLAALVNSAMAHNLDYDDIHDVARIHPSSVTLAASLAAAEIAQCKGDAVVDGVILGNELMCRLGRTITPLGKGPGADWFLSQLFGYLGAAFAAGMILGLSEDELVSAFGLAYMQMAGGKEPAFTIGANSRAIYTGFAAQGGLQAAILAKSGLLGPASSLDGVAGVFPLYLGTTPSEEDIRKLTSPEDWIWEDTAVKPWPCCRSAHPYVAVALSLKRRIGDVRIGRALVEVNARAGFLCRPLDERRRPTTLADAKYSIPFMVAFALAKGRVDMLSLEDASIADTAVLELAERVEIEQSLPDLPGPAPAKITLTLADGSIVSEQLNGGLVLDPEQVREKFLSCMEYGGLGRHAEALWVRLQKLDTMMASEIVPAFD